MPTYQYACTVPDCGHEFERVQSFSDDALSQCPECSGRLRKVWGSIGVVFKGSGFYRNDSRAGSGEPAGKDKGTDAAAKSESAAAKSDTSAKAETGGKSGSAKSESGTSGTSSGQKDAGTSKSAASSSSSGSGSARSSKSTAGSGSSSR